MEPRFKTSFIPKQNLSAAEPPSPSSCHRPKRVFNLGSLGTLVSLIIFLGTIGLAGGLFMYESYLSVSTRSKEEQLSLARKAFQPELIRQMARLDLRLSSAETLLNEHIAPSLLFQLLQNTTLQTVRFNTMTFLVMGPDAATFSLEGEAQNFAAVALQSDVFGSSQYIRDAVVSGFTVLGGGRVGFNLTGSIDPRLLSYAQTVSVDGAPVTPTQ